MLCCVRFCNAHILRTLPQTYLKPDTFMVARRIHTHIKSEYIQFIKYNIWRFIWVIKSLDGMKRDDERPSSWNVRWSDIGHKLYIYWCWSHCCFYYGLIIPYVHICMEMLRFEIGLVNYLRPNLDFLPFPSSPPPLSHVWSQRNIFRFYV